MPAAMTATPPCCSAPPSCSADSRAFDGTVYFIFQPAEENEGGSMRMIEDGAVRALPGRGVYAVHNWPGCRLERSRPASARMMAAVDNFELSFEGTGAHAAMPQLGDDPILAAGAFVQAVQRIVSRSVDPQTALVVSITQIHGGNVGNIVPGKVWLQGTCRFFEPALFGPLRKTDRRDRAGHCRRRMRSTAKLAYKKGYPPLINTSAATARAVQAAAAVVGREQVETEFNPSLGCEDFAYMVREAGGCYAWIGAGDVGPGRRAARRSLCLQRRDRPHRAALLRHSRRADAAGQARRLRFEHRRQRSVSMYFSWKLT